MYCHGSVFQIIINICIDLLKQFLFKRESISLKAINIFF